jgi:[acyl-carrier-protein] S-malonyltransferase
MASYTKKSNFKPLILKTLCYKILEYEAFVFRSGSTIPGMGKDLYEKSEIAKDLFKKANDILGFDISKIMFEGSPEELKQTKVTQPAIFIHSVILAKVLVKNLNLK